MPKLIMQWCHEVAPVAFVLLGIDHLSGGADCRHCLAAVLARSGISTTLPFVRSTNAAQSSTSRSAEDAAPLPVSNDRFLSHSARLGATCRSTVINYSSWPRPPKSACLPSILAPGAMCRIPDFGQSWRLLPVLLRYQASPRRQRRHFRVRDPKPKCGFGRDRSLKMPKLAFGWLGVGYAWTPGGRRMEALPMPCHRLGDCGRGSKWCRPLHPPAPADQPESKKQGCDVGTRQATLFQGVAKWG